MQCIGNFINASLVVLVLFLKATKCQYLHPKPTPTPAPGTCTKHDGTRLVEHFFNIIFSEFQRVRPVCVCVQMCVGQPTYCYPNGCSRKTKIETKKSVPLTVPILGKLENEVRVIVPETKEFLPYLNDFRGDNKMYHPQVPNTRPRDNSVLDSIRRNPFRDRYRSVFKHKGWPKLHFNYNLREQVKNVRGDRLNMGDVSKTRWPSKPNYNKDRKHFFIDAGPNQEKIDEFSKYKLFPVLSTNEIGPKYFKRDLRSKMKEVDNIEDGIDTTESPFVLDNLIEYLIEGSFQSKSRSNSANITIDIDVFAINDTTTETITLPGDLAALTDYNNYSNALVNDATDIISMNLTNENTDNNKYTKESEDTYKNTFNEMIESLSKNIERQNNSSIEFMRAVIGEDIEDFNDSTIVEITTEEISTEATSTVSTTSTTTTIPTITETEVVETVPDEVYKTTESTTVEIPLSSVSATEEIINNLTIGYITSEPVTNETSYIPRVKSRQKINRRPHRKVDFKPN